MTLRSQENRIRDAGSRAPAGATALEGDDSPNGSTATEPAMESTVHATSGPEATSSQGSSVEIVLSNGRVLKVVAHGVFPPIPDNRGDWQAYDDRTYDGSGPLGVGATREAAIRDLVEQICEREDICPPWCDCCQQERAS